MKLRFRAIAALALATTVFLPVLSSGAWQETPASLVPSICGSLAGAMASPPATHDDMMGGAQPEPDEALEFDLVYIDLMIVHHEGALGMAAVALERAEHPELRELALNIIDAQTSEIAQLRAWRDAWYPDAPTLDNDVTNAAMNGYLAELPDAEHHAIGPMDSAMEMMALCSASGPFDLVFIEMMIAHHGGAIAMAHAGIENSTHIELQPFHQSVIDAQQAEIDQMRAWRAIWYTRGTPTA